MAGQTRSRASGAKGTDEPITHDDIVRMVGDLEDSKISTILAMGPTVEELDEAIAWAEAESDVMGELEKPLSGVAAQVYEILMTRRDFGEDEH